MNEWLHHSFLFKGDACLINLFRPIRQRGVKIPLQSLYCIERYFPNTKEAQYMVDPVRVKIVGHLLEPANPPRVSLLLHRLPVIGWESPVLPVDGEIIRWCPRLCIHVKQVRGGPRVHAIPVNSYRD